MPLRRAALALPLLLACSAPPTPTGQDAAAKAEAPADVPAKPEREILKRRALKTDPPEQLVGKDLPPPPTLATTSLTSKASGTLALPDGIGVVLPHVALQLEQGLLIAGQAFVEYDPQIRSAAIWQYQGFVPTSGEPRVSRGESGSIRAGMLDGQGGAVLVGSLGVGMSAHVWAAKLAGDGSLVDELALANPGFSDALAIVGGGPAGELAVVAGFADTMAWIVAIDETGRMRWKPQITIEGGGYPQVRALARLDDQALLGVGTLAEKAGSAWSVRMASDGGTVEHAKLDPLDASALEIDSNRGMLALADRGAPGLVGLGLAKRGLVQDHDQVFAVGFDRTGKVTWTRAIEQVRATQVRGAIGWQGAALFVLEVPVGEGKALALLRIAGSANAEPEIRVEQIAKTEGLRSAGFIQGTATPELLVVSSSGPLSWQRLEVGP